MVVSCWVKGCTNRGSGTTKRSFFYIPRVRHHEGEQTERISEERRRLWLANIGRKSEPSNSLRICSDHFITGKPTSLYDRANPDWAPTLKLTDSLSPRKSDRKRQKTETDLKGTISFSVSSSCFKLRAYCLSRWRRSNVTGTCRGLWELSILKQKLFTHLEKHKSMGTKL